MAGLHSLDQFFTPPSVAHSVVEASLAASMTACLDPGCGRGDLLSACERVFPRVRCLGIDKDARAIAAIRRQHPCWTVAAGDILRPIPAVLRSAAWQRALGTEYVLMNPPFSVRATMGQWVHFGGRFVKCSVAMAHLLTTLETFQPRKGGAAIVPESMMYSDLDTAARATLGQFFTLSVEAALPNTTFSGARANALIVGLRRGRAGRAGPVFRPMVRRPDVRPVLVRGGLPLFEAHRLKRGGLPFVHTTELSLLTHAANGVSHLGRVLPIGRGVTSGAVILLPRVGVPRIDATQPIVFSGPVQLSDCVIALQFPSLHAAEAFSKALRNDWSKFLCLYRGTGARYTTVSRLAGWLGLPKA